MRLALATSREWPDLSPDDQPLMRSLAHHGIEASPVIWNDPSAVWADYQGVVIRSTWDYQRDLHGFLDWLRSIETAGVACWNPPSYLAWNSCKTYLRELASRGFRTVPTEWFHRGTTPDLTERMLQRGWQTLVIKPTVSASGRNTHRISDLRAGQSVLSALLEQGDVMVQPFLPSVQTDGEWSLIFFQGKFSHSVRKRTRANEFRVQEEYGGKTIAELAPRQLVDDAGSILDALNEPPLYARVDGFEEHGRLMLAELELIEPLLFLSYSHGAANRFADAIAQVACDLRENENSTAQSQ